MSHHHRYDIIQLCENVIKYPKWEKFLMHYQPDGAIILTRNMFYYII